MTNTKLLNDKIDESGLKKSYIAKAIGRAPSTLARKISGKQDFTASEINVLCEILPIETPEEKEAIFFAPEVAEMATT